MRNFLHKLKVADVGYNGGWLDISFTDTLPKGLKSMREWRFSYNTEDHSYYAVLYRSEGTYGPFCGGVELPKAMTDKLWFIAAPQVALWRLTQ